MTDEPIVEAQEWMPKPLYFTTEEGGDWLQFKGPEPSRTAAVIVLDSGDVLDVILGKWRERFDPQKMADIAKLFEPLDEGLGD